MRPREERLGPSVPHRSVLRAVVASIRPKQWTKNVFVLAAVVFAQRISHPPSVLRALIAFLIFCALSSVVYLVNDVADREADRLHPKKRLRPVASGEMSVLFAVVLAVAVGAAGLAASVAMGVRFASIATGYLLVNLAYSQGLKRIVILDVMIVALGFILRAWAGAEAIGVEISHWLILCSGLIALFLGFVKRRQEIVSLGGGSDTRPILREYSLPFLDQMIGVVTASTVLAYSLYALSPEVGEKLGTRHLGQTIPFVLFGIFRYLYLVHQRGEGENPAALVSSDVPLLVNMSLWGFAVLISLYLWR